MENEDPLENKDQQASADPWAAAFAALDKEEKGTAETAPVPPAQPDGDDGADSKGDDLGEGAAGSEGPDGNEPAADAGGPGDLGGADGGSDAGAYEDLFRFSEEEIKDYKDTLQKNIEQQTLRDVAQAYISKGARNTNGRLGATIDDADICKRDRDGVPRFYNPETGREFTGDNPRRQAQEWVDDYNRQLAQQFNQTCRGYAAKLMEEQGVGLKVIEFAPKYEKLDPVRKAMFESIIEDYEIHDKDGDLVGYSCDLDKALAAVNRQVKTMQSRFHKQEQAAPSGPVLDTKSTSAPGSDKVPEFKSLAEAMEWQQTQLLNKRKAK